MKEIWHSQRRELQELAISLGLPALGVQGALREALHFGEMLTLIQTKDSAARLMQEDRAGALSFLNLVDNLTEAIEKAERRPSTSEMSGPFHELADFAVEFLNELRRIAPQKFD